jgi:4-hydroxy-tetrahydrodipicolinate synthase
MRLLGMPAGACRRPLGKLTPQAAAIVVDAARQVWANDPALLQPIGDGFDVDIEARLADQAAIDTLVYSEY